MERHLWTKNPQLFLLESFVLYFVLVCDLFPRPKKIKLPFLKVTVSESYRFYVVESYRCPKVTVFLGRKLPFFVKKLPFFVIKLPFISESYRFGFSKKINGNFDTDKVTVYWHKVTVFSSQSYRFCEKVTVFIDRKFQRNYKIQNQIHSLITSTNLNTLLWC